MLHTFRTMGAAARIAVPDASAALISDAVTHLAALEQRWSRFVATSEISLLNESPELPAMVSADTAALVDMARIAHEQTDGWFDPTVLPALIDAGYDRSHELLHPAASGGAAPTAVPGPAVAPGAAPRLPSDALFVDRDLGLVHLGAGHRIDPGGIGKGLAADVTAGLLRSRGASWAQVELGGDVRVAGASPHGAVWPVHVADPFDAHGVLTTLEVPEGGVATSSRLRRRWTHSGSEQHHLIDPRTRRPSTTPLVAVTVVAGETWWAEVLAKAALLAGPGPGSALVERHGAAAVLVHDDGSVQAAGPIEPWLAAPLRRSSPTMGTSA